MIHPFSSILVNVTNFLFGNRATPHAYLKIEGDNLSSTDQKKERSPLIAVSQFIQRHFDHFTTRENKAIAASSWATIKEGYVGKHQSLIARIILIFNRTYCKKYVETLEMIEKTLKKIESTPIQHHTAAPSKLAQLKAAEKTAQELQKWGLLEQATRVRVEAAQQFSSASPFATLPEQIKKSTDSCLSIQPIGGSVFKHQTLFVRKKNFTDGSTRLFLEGKLSHPIGAALSERLKAISSSPLSFLKALPKEYCSQVSVDEECLSFYGRKDKNKEKFAGDFSTNVDKDGHKNEFLKLSTIHFHGIGKVKVGTSTYRGGYTFFNHMEIECDPSLSMDDAAKKIPILLASLGLCEALSIPEEEDVERLKLMQLFRISCPKQAYEFERDARTFEEPLSCLKERIIQKVPAMKEIIESHWAHLYPQEVYPGQFIWAVQGLAKEVEKAGGGWLMAGIVTKSFEEALRRLAFILRDGALSTVDRYASGIIAAGASSYTDIGVGGANCVFTRLLTFNMPKTMDSYPLSGQIQILYDLQLLERGGYAYTTDLSGTKGVNAYSRRKDILSLTKQYAADPNNFVANEVCIRNRIPPRFIKGVVVPSEEAKQMVIAHLKLAGLIEENSAKIPCIHGIPLDEFFHVGAWRDF